MNQTTEKLLKAGTLVCLLLALYILVLAVNGIKENRYIGGGISAGNVISVSGTGEVYATPDIAEVSFDVVVEKDTVAAAQEEATQKINATLAFLKDQDIAERDIKTTNYSSNPRYEWRSEAAPVPAGNGTAGVSYPVYNGGDTRVLVGYEVRQSVTVKIRDTEKVGAVVAGLGELSVTNMYGPNFTIDDEDALTREARKEAIDDAEAKAKELAKDLGVKLVRIVSFSESGGPYYPYYRGMEMIATDSAEAPKATPEIPAGENKISSYVTITYEIR